MSTRALLPWCLILCACRPTPGSGERPGDDAGTGPAPGVVSAPGVPSGAPASGKEAGAPVAVQPRLQRTAPLPELARSIVQASMGRHADRAQTLLWSALMLDYPSLETAARALTEEPRIARPSDAEPEVANAMFPVAFFDLQDELHDRANALWRAAGVKDDAAIAEHYGQLTKACVACHGLYLRLPAAASDVLPPSP